MFGRAIEHVLPSVIATDQMTERSLSITPVPVTLLVSLQRLRALELTDFVPQRVVLLSDVHFFELLVAGRLVNSHIEGSKMQLPQVEQRVIDVLRRDQLGDQRLRNLL